MPAKITTYDRKDFYENWEEVNKDLGKRWDSVVKNSPHKDLQSPTMTDHYFVSALVKTLLEYLPKKKGLKVLKYDLYNEATSTTTLADWFLANGYIYYGVDISKEVVRLAQKNFKNKTDTRRFKVGDIRKLPFESNTFDAVFSYGTIEHIRENQEAVNEAFRVLKPGGVFITGVNNRIDIWLGYLVNEFFNHILKNITSYEPSYFPWQQKNWLKNAGFKKIKVSGMIIFSRIIRYADLFVEWKGLRGLPRMMWDYFLIYPFIVLARLMEKSEFLRLFSLQTVSVGYKPKRLKK